MVELKEFDPNDPIDAIADLMRKEVADAALRVLDSRTYVAAADGERAEGMIYGLMVGALGTIIASCQEGSDAAVRAALRKHFDFWFDRALELNHRQTLGDIQ